MNTAPMPLSGVRVLDASRGPTAGLATMVLADFGADVIKLEPPEGDPYRELPSAPLWLRGKRSVVTTESRRIESLARWADVWVSGPTPDTSLPGDDALAALNPRLIIAWVTAFGRTGPYAAYPPYESLVAAKLGRMLQFRGLPSRTGPAYSALQVATHAASQSLLSGILAALQARERDGVGQLIETSMLRGLLVYEMGPLLGVQLDERRRARGEPDPPPVPDPAVALPTLNYHPLRTKDGRWLQMGNLLPHLFMNFVRAVGLEREYQALGVDGPTSLWPEAARESFRDLMLERLQTRTLDEWQRHFIADGGVASHPYQTTQQAFDDEDLLANGHSLPLGDDGQQLGLLAQLTRTPGAVRRAAPAVGEHTAEVLCETERVADAEPDRTNVADRAAASTRARRKPPLDGVTVVEAATIIAAPFAASLLADLGARVIKFEPIEGDPFRAMAPGLGAARVNYGKESICLDLKQREAQAIAQKLVAKADLFIHNYRPGVPERLGIGYEQLAALNPKLVYLSANGYGPKGPGALRPSTHPIPGAALGGVLHQIGGAPDDRELNLAELRENARRLMRANDVNPDPNTSLVICSTALLGLAALRRHGVGQAIFVDMFGANAYANWDDALRYPDKRARVSPDREGHGLNPLWRLYPCASGWVFLAIGNRADWARLREAMAALLARGAGATGSGSGSSGMGTAASGANGSGTGPAAVERWLQCDFEAARGGGTALVQILEQTFAALTADEWERNLALRGVGCVRADAGLPEQFLLNDAHARLNELTLPAHHAEWGEFRRHGAQVVLHGTPGHYGGATLAGEHTDALLAELGMNAAQRSGLRAGKTVA